jgi:hypothetical protein
MTRSSYGIGPTLARWWTFITNAICSANRALGRFRSTALVTILGLVLLAGPLAPLETARAEDEWTNVSTRHFRVEASNAHAAQASWYAAFVEQVHDELSDLLVASLDRTIRVRLYPTEEAYVAANPAAASAQGILAHAHPTGDEIGLALVRLEALSGPSRVAAFRHEVAHLLLDKRSDRRLPIAFQEGIAQYVERDPNTDRDTVEGLRRAYSADRLLSWTELFRTATFQQQPNIAYPESHSMVAYLVEKHGVGAIGRLLDALRDGQDIQPALMTAFSTDSATLERDWRGSVPSVLTSGLPRNVLDDGNLRPAQQAAAEQRWTDAAALARVAEQFWKDIGQGGRAEDARSLADLAEGVLIFRQADEQAQQMLAERHYREASDLATVGIQRLPASADPAYRTQLQMTAERAQAGLQGEESLELARTQIDSYRIIDAQRSASLAEQQLMLAGDDARAAEARDIRMRSQSIQQMLATIALGVALLSGGAFWLNRSRSAPPIDIGAPRREVQL